MYKTVVTYCNLSRSILTFVILWLIAQLRFSVGAYSLALITPAPAPTPHKDLTGVNRNLTGNLPRNLSGNSLTGHLTGNLTGNMPRNLSGSLTSPSITPTLPSSARSASQISVASVTHGAGTPSPFNASTNPVKSTPSPSQNSSQIPSQNFSQIHGQISSQNLPDFGRFETEEELLAFMSAYSDRYTTGPTPTSTPTSTQATPTYATPAYSTPTVNIPSTGTIKTGPVKSPPGPGPVKSPEILTKKPSLFDDKRGLGSGAGAGSVGVCVYELVRSVGRRDVGVGSAASTAAATAVSAAEGDDLALSVCLMMDFDDQVQPDKIQPKPNKT